jgi:hypothetical protein
VVLLYRFHLEERGLASGTINVRMAAVRRLVFEAADSGLLSPELAAGNLSAATVNLHLSAIRRLADEAAESGWSSPELAIGIRRVKDVKRLGRRIGNWLTGHQVQNLSECHFSTHPSREKRCCNDRTTTRMWSASVRNRKLKIGSAAIAAEPLGDRRYAWEGRETANGSCADLV